MPWCFGVLAGAYWWILPLIALAVMALVFFVCFRRFGGLRRCGCLPGSGDVPASGSDADI